MSPRDGWQPDGRRVVYSSWRRDAKALLAKGRHVARIVNLGPMDPGATDTRYRCRCGEVASYHDWDTGLDLCRAHLEEEATP